MSQLVNGSENLSVEVKTLYGPVAAEIEQSEAILRRELTSEYAQVDEMVGYGSWLGGKRLRPALLLLAAKSIGEVNDDHLTLAAVVEMIHTATLVHDDVLDGAQLRRHLETCNARWDNEASVLLGDYLFTHAFFLASTLNSTFACRTIGKATNKVCEGELRQIRSCHNFEMAEAEYIDIIDAKTAALCRCACRLGAHFSGASDEMVLSLTDYGRNLGIAFQIIDDLLDIIGDEAEMGKSLGTDLDQHKPTLPLIHVLRHVSVEERDNVINAIGDGSPGRNVLSPWMERFDTLEYVRERARWFADQAIAKIAWLEKNEAVHVLQKLPEFVLARAK